MDKMRLALALATVLATLLNSILQLHLLLTGK